MKTCPAHNLKLGNKKAATVFDDCIMCGQCTAVCPKAAVSISGFFTMAANVSLKIKKAIKMPKKKRAAMTLVLGYPSVKYFRSAPRKKLNVRYM